MRDGSWSPAATASFTVSATSDYGFELTGTSQVVPSSSVQCDGYDIPDGSAAAFRNSAGQVNLVSPSDINWRSVGSTLNDVQKNCTPIFRSAWDQAYENFRNSVRRRPLSRRSRTRVRLGERRDHGRVARRRADVHRPADHVASRPPVGGRSGIPATAATAGSRPSSARSARATCSSWGATTTRSFSPRPTHWD